MDTDKLPENVTLETFDDGIRICIDTSDDGRPWFGLLWRGAVAIGIASLLLWAIRDLISQDQFEWPDVIKAAIGAILLLSVAGVFIWQAILIGALTGMWVIVRKGRCRVVLGVGPFRLGPAFSVDDIVQLRSSSEVQPSDVMGDLTKHREESREYLVESRELFVELENGKSISSGCMPRQSCDAVATLILDAVNQQRSADLTPVVYVADPNAWLDEQGGFDRSVLEMLPKGSSLQVHGGNQEELIIVQRPTMRQRILALVSAVAAVVSAVALGAVVYNRVGWNELDPYVRIVLVYVLPAGLLVLAVASAFAAWELGATRRAVSLFRERIELHVTRPFGIVRKRQWHHQDTHALKLSENHNLNTGSVRIVSPWRPGYLLISVPLLDAQWVAALLREQYPELKT